MSFKGKTAVVTGGSTGIGLEVALELTSRGMSNIAINSIFEDAPEALSALKKAGANAKYFKADVSNKAEVNSYIDQVVEDFGSIDVLVNNAGITADALGVRLKEEDFDKVVRINLKGTFLVTQAASKYMIKQRAGSIVNLASVIGITGNIGQVNYAASKGGVIAVTKSFAKELAGRNIRVNAIAPGFIDTDMTRALSDKIREQIADKIPLGRFGTPREAARLIAFLASEDASYITGQVIVIDGGLIN